MAAAQERAPGESGVKLDRRIQLFVVLSGVFITSLVVGDIIAVKLVQPSLAGVTGVLSVGMVPFPVTFLLTDILNEFYGKRAARFVTFVGLGMALFAFGVIGLASALPWAPFTLEPGYTGTAPASFDNVFGGSQRILVASMVAYLIGQLLDIWIFNALKRASANHFLWLRATGSTVLSQWVDTVVVQVVAWTGILTGAQIVHIVLTSYFFKVLAAVALTPLIYAGHALVERRLGMEPVMLGPDGEPLEEPIGSSGS
jgi:uncharacterized integral membrane protein (TIGR00697 family)